MHAHSHTSTRRRSGTGIAANARPAGLAGSALAVLALAAVLLAGAGGGVGGHRVASAMPPGLVGHPVARDGTGVTQRNGILHAPRGYAPPGLWTPRSGPGPVGG